MFIDHYVSTCAFCIVVYNEKYPLSLIGDDHRSICQSKPDPYPWGGVIPIPHPPFWHRRTCVFCRCASSMELATDIVETVSINRNVQAQTENISVYFIIRSI